MCEVTAAAADLEILTPDEVATILRASPSKNPRQQTRTP
jgi:hypothetical protein